MVIVVLTWRQLAACRHWGTALHKRYLEQSRERTTHGHEVAMPPIGWETLAGRMIDQAFNPFGKHRRQKMSREGVPATRSALTAVMNAVTKMQIHPALRNEHIQGAHGDVLLAWRTPEGQDLSVFPVRDCDPVILVPSVRDQTFRNGDQPFKMQITSWWPLPVGTVDVPGAFLDPQAHWEFLVVDNDEATSRVLHPDAGVEQVTGP